MNYKGYDIPDKEIDKIVDKGFSIVDACEMWLSDHDMIEDETVEELTKKATKNRVTATIHQAKGEKKARKTREKKENPLKKEIISIIYKAIFTEIDDIHSILVRNDEKYIDLMIGNRDFTINLVEHRKKKG